VNSLPKTRQRRGCDLNPGPSAPESSTLSTRLPSHPEVVYDAIVIKESVALSAFEEVDVTWVRRGYSCIHTKR